MVKVTIPFLLLAFPFLIPVQKNSWVRINQLGYLPESIKVAVFISEEKEFFQNFSLINKETSEEVFLGKVKAVDGSGWGMPSAYRLDFSNFEKPGFYYLKAGNAVSPQIKINADVYSGTADFILNYMRQQRCGFNPYLNDSCHLHDGIIVDHPTRSGEFIDVSGGWHDATDYLQYTTTSANALYQMMFAWQKHPEVFGDSFQANGLSGENGIPDILDEIKWGLDWLLKMNPSYGEMYNQIADDRDHIGFRLPVGDTADYGLGLYRPVYFVTGEPQGLAEFKNHSTGVSSVAGKFASCFAMAARIFQKFDPELSALFEKKAVDAYKFGKSKPGYCQTACNVSPYFYEEESFADDMELAASELFQLISDAAFADEAMDWARQESVTPWMEKGEARHYQYYPFVNLGHFNLSQDIEENRDELINFYRQGLTSISERGEGDPFFYGIPFIWCSNNLVVATITQARLYAELSGSKKFAEMEAALRDWLFGCNPWGIAMICGLPGVEDSPENPHSSYTVLLGETTYGGLVDGPVYRDIFKNQIGVTLTGNDPYSLFQNGKAVYHDDIGDYTTNEPTMDGTASLSFYLASLESRGRNQKLSVDDVKDHYGAVIRKNPEEKNIYLAFTSDSYFEGGRQVIKILRKRNCKASFFFTGNFLRNKKFREKIKKIIRDGHYIGIHSDKHLLYCDWQVRDSTLVTYSEFKADIKDNFRELGGFGIKKSDAKIFMPPYEWYNREIVEWCNFLGLTVVNFTPGTGTNADYTTPDMPGYKTSEELLDGLHAFEKNNPEGLNGAIVLIHPGTDPARTDKFYFQLEKIISEYQKKGYRFKSLQPF